MNKHIPRTTILRLQYVITAFVQDIDPVQAKVLVAAQKPFNKSILAEKSGPQAWKQLPSWYQVSENDNAIPPDAERMYISEQNKLKGKSERNFSKRSDLYVRVSSCS
jgi:hypothetical protein